MPSDGDPEGIVQDLQTCDSLQGMFVDLTILKCE